MLRDFRTLIAVAASASILLIAAIPTTAQDGRLLARHQAVGQSCVACHRESPPRQKPADATCMSCHGDQARLAAATAKAQPNPHAPPHLAAGASQACGDCHSIHKQSEVTCTDCHRGFQFNVK